jgi:hypothetical protein
MCPAPLASERRSSSSCGACQKVESDWGVRRATYILAGCSTRGVESGRGWRESGRGEGKGKRRRGGGLNCGLEVAGGSAP